MKHTSEEKFSSFKGEIYAKFGNQQKFLKQYNSKNKKGMTLPAFTKKMKGESDFKLREILQIKNLFGWSADRCKEIFILPFC